MGRPHNPKRYGEQWDQREIDAAVEDIELIKDLVKISGGWAWHFISPGHTEYKHAHDHKDIDLWVEGRNYVEFAQDLAALDYVRISSRFDSQDFKRFEKVLEEDGKRIKIILDVFMEPAEEIPFLQLPSGIRVVEPKYLLSLYGWKHDSDHCFSVQIAKELVDRGLDPVGHPQMIDYSRWVKE